MLRANLVAYNDGRTRLDPSDVIPAFEPYRAGIEALLQKLDERRLKTLVMVQDGERGIIFLGQWNVHYSSVKRLVTFAGNGEEGDIHLNYLEAPNSVGRTVLELHRLISMTVDVAKTIVMQGLDPVGACKMIDNVDRYNEAIRILNSP